jgi:CheY-like chemotaxis protein
MGDSSTGVEEAPLRVLYVEDNETNRQIMGFIFGAVNAQLTFAENGLEGVKAYEQDQYDVVLMDLQMPVMDGHTATREIRGLEVRTGRPRTPIVVVSANVQSADISQSRDAGADGHLGKPVDVEALFSTISTVLTQQAA